MTEFISRNHGHECYEIIIKTTNHEHYKAAEDFARRLIDHAKPVTDNNVGCKWIPVTEGLPYVGSRVLACGEKGGVFVVKSEGKTTGFGRMDGASKYRSFTHWMPLPQPPKGE